MPTYVYGCDSCGHRFEKVQKFSDEPLRVCPECGAPVRKIIQPAGIVFKGSGWHITDYKRSGGANGSSDGESKSESSAEAKADTKGDATASAEGSAKSESKSASGGSSSTAASS